MSRSSNSRVKPAWLEGLMAETFFGGCGVHQNQRKNEKNVFCLHCCLSICLHCLPSHPSHSMLQVRRYVYNDVIRLGDLEKLIDCSYIQPYTINGAKVIFLNQRHQTRSCKGSSNICYTCDRILQEPFHFCSLSCKVDRLAFQGENLSSILHRFDESNFPIFQFKGLRMDGLEVIDDERQVTTSSVIKKHVASSCPNETTSSSLVSKEQIVVKKNSGFLSRIGLSLGNRRKGAPQRAPLS